MRIATSWSNDTKAETAFQEAFNNLTNEIKGYPSLLFVYFTEHYSSDSILASMAILPPGVKVHGCTSCQGVMTQDGVHGVDGPAIALFGIQDVEGAYGVGAHAQGGNPRDAAMAALTLALADADRPGELPDLIWFNAPPGQEESILLGMQEVVGVDTLIVGGSAADNQVAGRWRVLTRDIADGDSLVVSVLFPSCRIGCSFQSGYSPCGPRGVVTSASGRVVHTIDDEPAAQVYNKWTRGLIDAALPMGGNVLFVTSLSPLGRVAGRVGDISYFTLSHPEMVLADGSLRLFTEVQLGQELFLMEGSKETLIARAARVTEAAIALDSFSSEAVLGVVMVYCAGCMLTVQDRMSQVVDALNQTLNGKPFIGIFTFGEQGSVLRGGTSHGNLMISSLVFSN
ncbi:FIST N-terminal domain-containing protein [Rhodoferax sp. GW822-FHT02A01]|uniref:FIST signal transduction protein n=1 Tax=Rhodoferax sp. GW822-FHT02A01 TaxID=3141537 RepID=UPI00315D86E6